MREREKLLGGRGGPSLDDVVAGLRRTKLFAREDERTLATLVDDADVERLPPNAMLWSKGDSLSSLAYVHSGVLHVCNNNQHLRELRPGQLVGVAMVFGDVPANADVRAIERSIVVHIPSAAANALADKKPHLLREAIRYLNDLVIALTGERQELHLRARAARVRVLDWLRKHADENGVIADAQGETIATDLDLHVRHVNKMKKELRAKGLIRYEDRKARAELVPQQNARTPPG